VKTFQVSPRPAFRAFLCLTISLLLLAGCRKAPDDRVQGYVEGEFVYVSSPLAGTVEKLAVQRGQQVAAAAPLFALDGTMELAARDQAQAALVLSEAEYKRQEMLVKMGPSAVQEFDRARAARDQDRQRLTQSEWNLAQMKQDAPQAGLV
jgi:HlyD family secretion protein